MKVMWVGGGGEYEVCVVGYFFWDLLMIEFVSDNFVGFNFEVMIFLCS